MQRINFIGRGGQGVVKASRITVDVALQAGQYATALPTFDFVRRGGPVEAFVRLADEPIRRKSTVEETDVVVAFDAGMKELGAALDRTTEGATVLLNTTADPREVDVPARVLRVGCVDATSIANELLGKNPIPVVNTTMLGSLTRVLEAVDREALEETYREQFGDGAEANIEAASRAYEQTTVWKKP